MILASVVSASALIGKPTISEIFSQCRSRRPGLPRVCTSGRWVLNVSIADFTYKKVAASQAKSKSKGSRVERNHGQRPGGGW